MSIEMIVQVSDDGGIIPGIPCRQVFAVAGKIQVSAAGFGGYCIPKTGRIRGCRPGCFP
jgi:hypothetical protein